MAEDELAELRRRVEALEAKRTIEVERIDVVEPDGTLRMALTNQALAPDPVVDGQTFTRSTSRNPPGIIFYNDDGDECGGLVFGNEGGALLFDQYKQDQVIGIMHRSNFKARKAGLYVWDRPDGPIPATAGGALRMFSGKSPDGSVSVELHDGEGRVRLRLAVTADGAASVEFLNDAGEVTGRLPA